VPLLTRSVRRRAALLAEDCVVPDERKRHHCTDNRTARIPLDEAALFG